MKILEDKEYIVQKAYAKKGWQVMATLSFILVIIGFALLALDLIYNFFDSVKSFLPIGFSKNFDFFKNDIEIILFLCLLGLSFLVVLFGFIQFLLNKSRHLIITNKRFIIKQSRKKVTALAIKEFDSINLAKSNIELVRGSELYLIKKLNNSKSSYLLAEWAISLAKTMR